MNRPSTWWSPDIAPDQVETIIKEAFPSVDFVHFGEASRQWWAMVHGRMVGAADLDQLYERIITEEAGKPGPRGAVAAPPASADGPISPPPWPAQRPDGRATPRTGAPLPMLRQSVIPSAGAAGRMLLPYCPDASQRPAAPLYPPLYPPPGRLRRFLNACRRFFLGDGGEDW